MDQNEINKMMLEDRKIAMKLLEKKREAERNKQQKMKKLEELEELKNVPEKETEASSSSVVKKRKGWSNNS